MNTSGESISTEMHLIHSECLHCADSLGWYKKNPSCLGMHHIYDGEMHTWCAVLKAEYAVCCMSQHALMPCSLTVARSHVNARHTQSPTLVVIFATALNVC